MSQSLTSIEVARIWKQTCRQLKQELSPAVYNTWIVANPVTQINYINQDEVEVVISSPTAFHSTNLKKNLNEVLVAALGEVIQSRVVINYQIGQFSPSTNTSTKIYPKIIILILILQILII